MTWSSRNSVEEARGNVEGKVLYERGETMGECACLGVVVLSCVALALFSATPSQPALNSRRDVAATYEQHHRMTAGKTRAHGES